jgi:hypothetical protein
MRFLSRVCILVSCFSFQYQFIEDNSKNKVDKESILSNFDFSVFPIFAFELGHFKVQTIFSYATNTKAYQQKTEKIFVLQRKKVW